MNVEDLNVDLKIYDANQKLIQKLEIICPFDQNINIMNEHILNSFGNNSVVFSKVEYYYKDQKLDSDKKIYNYFQFFQDQYLLTSAIPIDAFLDIIMETSTGQSFQFQSILDLLNKKKFDEIFLTLDEHSSYQLKHFWYGKNFLEESDIFENQNFVQEINNGFIQSPDEDKIQSLIQSYQENDIAKFSMFINYSIYLLEQKNYIQALETLKNCSKILIQMNQFTKNKSFYLSKCYLLISICLIKTEKLEEAGNILNKAMKFLFESQIYDIFYLNNYIALLFSIDKRTKSIHKVLAKYLKHCEKLLNESEEIIFSHKNLIFVTNLLSILKQLKIDNPFKDILDRAQNYLQKQYQKLFVLKFFFPKLFMQISEDLIQVILMKIIEQINDQPDYLIMQIETIIEQQDYLSDRITSYQIDIMNIKACLTVNKDYDSAMNCLTDSIEFSKKFDSNHPVHKNLLKNLNIFNSINNQNFQ